MKLISCTNAIVFNLRKIYMQPYNRQFHLTINVSCLDIDQYHRFDIRLHNLLSYKFYSSNDTRSNYEQISWTETY